MVCRDEDRKDVKRGGWGNWKKNRERRMELGSGGVGARL